MEIFSKLRDLEQINKLTQSFCTNPCPLLLGFTDNLAAYLESIILTNPEEISREFDNSPTR